MCVFSDQCKDEESLCEDVNNLIPLCLNKKPLIVEKVDGSKVPCSDGVINDVIDKDRARMFIDLMCYIHRDGGHYMAEHGEKKAYEDAIEKILPLIQEHL